MTVTLPVTGDCTASGAVCTEDGKKLSGEVTHTFPGPDSVAAAGPVEGFTLVDASDQTQVATLHDGAVVQPDDPDNGSYAIRADVDADSDIGSVYLELTGAKERCPDGERRPLLPVRG